MPSPPAQRLTDEILLSDIRAFTMVAAAGSMTDAADALGEHKGGISRRIARLEERLGLRLLVRGPRTVTLTEEGQEFLGSARQALTLLDDSGAILRDRRSEPGGKIRVSAPMDFSVHVLPALFREFLARHPQVTIELIASDEMLELDANDLDVALRATRDLDDSSLVATRLIGFNLGLYAPESYLRVKGRPRSVPELARHDVLLFGTGSPSSELVLRNAGKTEKVLVHTRLRTSSMAVMLAAAVEGLGIAVLPDVLAATAAGSSLERVLPDHQLFSGSLYMITRKNRLLPRKTQVLRDFLVEKLRP